MCILGVIGLLFFLLVGLGLLFFPRARAIGLCVIAVVVMFALYFLYVDVRMAKGFHEIKIGMEAPEVLSVMGKPAEINDGTYQEYGYKRVDCKASNLTQYWYYSFYLPHIWLVVFDENMKVKSMTEQTSP
jgi:hypothetical protein